MAILATNRRPATSSTRGPKNQHREWVTNGGRVANAMGYGFKSERGYPNGPTPKPSTCLGGELQMRKDIGAKAPTQVVGADLSS